MRMLLWMMPILMVFMSMGQPSSDKIIWNSEIPLTWDDFQASPDLKSPFAASTHTGIHFRYGYEIKYQHIKVNFSVESSFTPSKSWYRPEKVSPAILKHEQTHFDISELFARKLRKRMSEKRFSKKVKKEIETIYLEIDLGRQKMQKRFDQETHHSQNLKKEQYWENYVQKQLKLYDAWQ